MCAPYVSGRSAIHNNGGALQVGRPIDIADSVGDVYAGGHGVIADSVGDVYVGDLNVRLLLTWVPFYAAGLL